MGLPISERVPSSSLEMGATSSTSDAFGVEGNFGALPPNWERLLAVVFEELGEPEVPPSLFLLRLAALDLLLYEQLEGVETRVVSTASSSAMLAVTISWSCLLAGAAAVGALVPGCDKKVDQQFLG